MPTTWGTLQLGRLTVREGFTADAAMNASTGLRTLTVTGEESSPPLELWQVYQRQEDLLGLLGRYIPVSFTDKTDHNGFYRVVDANAGGLTNWGNEVVKFSWQVQMERVGPANGVDVSSRLTGVARTNDFGLSGERWHAPAASAYGYFTGVGSQPSGSVQRPVADGGALTVYRGVPASASPRWGTSEAAYQRGRVRVLVGGQERVAVNVAASSASAAYAFAFNDGTTTLITVLDGQAVPFPIGARFQLYTSALRALKDPQVFTVTDKASAFGFTNISFSPAASAAVATGDVAKLVAIAVTDPGQWELGNGLVRVTQGASSTLTVAAYDGTQYEHVEWNVSVTGSATGGLTSWDAFTILRNDYELATVRLVRGTTPGASAAGRVVLDLTLRRGSRLVEATLQTDASTTLGVYRASNEAGTAPASGGHVVATSNDAAGNRYVVVTPRSFTAQTTVGGIAASAATRRDFALGAVVGGSAALSGDTASAMVAQYLTSMGLTDMVVVR